ncbi:MAG: hypothetical protein HFH68_00740 [Lachnospiraceae bacterium]|nr:hypothetical protein [Lachnospiraceae bacterium]
MNTIRQKINMVAEEVIKKENNNIVTELKSNSFVIVYNKYQQMYDLSDLLETELSEKLHGREKFELITLSGNENLKDIRYLMNKMANDCVQKSVTGLQVFAKASLELVIADNHCPIETIDMIHSMAYKVFQEETGFKFECTDYLVFDLSSQNQQEEVSAGWLKELEIYYKKHKFIPVICTEELLVRKEDKYKKAIKTIASLITMDIFHEKDIDVQPKRQVTWRCAAYIENDKLRHYIAGLFYKFMNNQNRCMMSEQSYTRYMESFLQDCGITINPGEVAKEMKGMPVNLEGIIHNSIHKLPVIKKKNLITIEEMITKVYGNNNPIRKYADLNYLDMHISGQKEYLWEKFQTDIPGTRKDVEIYLENVIILMIKQREKSFQELNEKIDDNKKIRIELNKYTSKNNKLYVERLFNDFKYIFLLMSEMENIYRELTALRGLYDKIKTPEFKQELKDIKDKQDKIIYFLGNREEEAFTYLDEGHDDMFNELFRLPGYWKMGTIEEDIIRKITQNINLHSQEIFRWQKRKSKEIFTSFLNNVWKRKNKINDYEANDFWSVRNDRLRPPLEEHEYIFINKGFFEENINEKELLSIDFPKAGLIENSHQSIFSVEYINIHDMDCLELLVTKNIHGDVDEDADNRSY